MFGLMIIFITLTICVTILLSKYMDYCASNSVGMFVNPRYEERIRILEKIIYELKEK